MNDLRSQLLNAVEADNSPGLASRRRPRRVHATRSRAIALRAHLAAMPVLPANLLLLTGVAGYTLREAATILGCTVAQAHQETLRAMCTLARAHPVAAAGSRQQA